METHAHITQLTLGPLQNFIYLIGDPVSREAAVVDPGWEVPAILKALEREGYRLTKIFLTHYHFDHVGGLEELLRHADVPVYAHRNEAPFLEIGRSSLKLLSGGETLEVGRLGVQILHTPGHTPGSQCLLVDGQLVTGDTLFIRACGRWDLPGGNPEQLYHSLTQTLKRLDDQTVVLPGHNYAEKPTSTIGDEKRENPFLQIPTAEAFLKLVGRSGDP